MLPARQKPSSSLQRSQALGAAKEHMLTQLRCSAPTASSLQVGGIEPVTLRRTTGASSFPGMFFSTLDRKIHHGGFVIDKAQGINADLIPYPRSRL